MAVAVDYPVAFELMHGQNKHHVITIPFEHHAFSLSGGWEMLRKKAVLRERRSREKLIFNFFVNTFLIGLKPDLYLCSSMKTVSKKLHVNNSLF